MRIERFEDIEAWQLARRLAAEIWAVTNRGSFAQDHGLRSQIHDSSGSAMDNIAEGFDGGSNAECVRFLRYAQRSCSEVQSQLHRALDRGHIKNEEFAPLYELADHVHAKTGAFIKYLKSTYPQVREPGPDTPWEAMLSPSVPTEDAERRTKNEERSTKNEARRTKNTLPPCPPPP